MVLEASRQRSQATQLISNTTNSYLASKAQKKEPCEYCNNSSHPSRLCYMKFPHLAPEWFKLRMKEQAKGQGKWTNQAREFQAKLATARIDDFVDGGTHISA